MKDDEYENNVVPKQGFMHGDLLKGNDLTGINVFRKIEKEGYVLDKEPYKFTHSGLQKTYGKHMDFLYRIIINKTRGD